MADFTPGPWTFEGPAHSIIVYGPEPEQRICFMTSDGPTEANARLIASAPTLAAENAALKALVAEMVEGLDVLTQSADDAAFAHNTGTMDDAISRARALIARAKGAI